MTNISKWVKFKGTKKQISAMKSKKECYLVELNNGDICTLCECLEYSFFEFSKIKFYLKPKEEIISSKQK